MLDLKDLVNDEQMINNNMKETTVTLKGFKVDAKVVEGEKLEKIFKEDIVR